MNYFTLEFYSWNFPWNQKNKFSYFYIFKNTVTVILILK